MNIYSWIEQNAKKMPQKTCMIYEGKTFSFAELHKTTSAFSTALKNHGIKKGDRIALMLNNMPEFVISYLSIIRLGAIVITVNPAYTSRELAHILKDSGAKGIILETRDVEIYNKIKETHPLNIIITVGENGNFSSLASGPFHDGSEDMDPDDTAVIVYTAGLTGYPMGAMLTHRNLDHNSDLLRLCQNGNDEDTTLALIPCFHTFGASGNMLSMLRYGGTIYLMKKLDFKEFHYAITQGGVNIVCAVPTLFYGLLHHPDLANIDYTRMKVLISGGSALPVEVYNGFKEKFHADIRQGYGLTEASPTCAVINRFIKIKPESIGKTVPMVDVKIVDEHDNILAPNKIGELLFKGPNIMKGYYKRPTETADVIKNGWLYTGDLGYVDEEGYIYITGYKKEMIITAGYNVYNKEVEMVLNSIPGVKDSAITGEADLMRGNIVKAYIVKENPALTEKEVKQLSRTQLASYKAPRKIVFVKEIPRDANGKVLLENIEPL